MIVSPSRRAPTLVEAHWMSPTRLRKFFAQATPDQIEELTVPCTGVAHVEGSDYCLLCRNCVWGRMLKPV